MKTIRLRDVCDFNQQSLPSKIDDLDINYLDTGNIYLNKISNIQNFSSGSPKPSRAKRLVSENDIIFSLVRPNQCHVGFIDQSRSHLVVSSGFSTVTVKDATVHPKYLYYLLTLSSTTEHLSRIAATNTSSYPALNPEDLENLEIRIHEDVLEQKKVADFLDLFEKEIALRLRMNELIENVLSTIYGFWFLQFDFPSSEGKPYKSSGGSMRPEVSVGRDIPMDWDVNYVRDLAPVITGKKDANFASPNGKYPFFTCAKEISFCDEHDFEGKAILVAGNGSFDIKLYNGKFNAYQRTYIIIPAEEKYFTLLYLVIKDRISSLSNGSRGSIVKFITMDDLTQIEIPLPREGFSNKLEDLNKLSEMVEINNKVIKFAEKKFVELSNLIYSDKISITN
jgi:type I restriction enzyme S subunit